MSRPTRRQSQRELQLIRDVLAYVRTLLDRRASVFGRNTLTFKELTSVSRQLLILQDRERLDKLR